MSSARLHRPRLGEVGGLGAGERSSTLREGDGTHTHTQTSSCFLLAYCTISHTFGTVLNSRGGGVGVPQLVGAGFVRGDRRQVDQVRGEEVRV